MGDSKPPSTQTSAAAQPVVSTTAVSRTSVPAPASTPGTHAGGPAGTVLDFDLTDIDIELEEETEEAKKEISICAKLVWTKEQEEDLLEAFNLLDHAGDGKIKADDFRVAIKALGYEPTKEELQQMVNEVDKGHSGKLSFENFQTAIARKVMSRDTDVDVMKSFRLFDDDENGLISFDNLKRVTQILGTYLTDEEIEEMIDDADKDFDGFVSVAEFMKMMRNSVKIVTP